MHEIKKEGKREDEITTWVFEGFTPTAKIVKGKSYSIISDYLGTPLQAIDAEGKLIWERELDIYGRIRKETKETANFVPFLYQGQYFDSETDLCYNRFRYYDPSIGTYISQDPIGLAGGNPTLYGYVFDSNTEIDPFGLGCVENKREGLRREDTLRRILEDIYGKDRVLAERTLVDVSGNKVTHKGKGRRIDFIVLDDNGNAIKSFEVTSKTADKTKQIRKENAIRAKGGTYIKDSNGNRIDISNIPTKIIRIK